MIFTTMTEPDEDMLDMGRKYNVPILVTEKTTSNFMAEIIRWLKCAAGTVHLHSWCTGGCIWAKVFLSWVRAVSVKSEAALELIKRGHRSGK